MIEQAKAKDVKAQREKTLKRKTMRLMLLHFEHSHDFSLKSAFDKLKNNCTVSRHSVEPI